MTAQLFFNKPITVEIARMLLYYSEENLIAVNSDHYSIASVFILGDLICDLMNK